MDTVVRALYVRDDDLDVARPAQVERGVERLTVETASGASEALDRLTTDAFDCVLATYELPDGDGLTLLRRLAAVDPDLPVVLCAQHGSEEVASEAIAAGVADYITAGPETDPSALATRVVEAGTPEADPFDQMLEVAEATEDVLWLISAEWDEVLFVNSAYAEVWGQSEATLRANPLSVLDAVHPEDRARAKAGIERLAEGESVEVVLRVNPQEEFDRQVLVRAEPIVGPDGEVDRVAGVSRDITEQRVRQRRLEEEQRMVDSIFDALPDVLYTFDTDGYLLRWNDQLEAETGYTGSEIEEMYVTDFVSPDEMETIATSFQTIIEDRRPVTVESAFQTKSGERVPFEFTGAPLADADGNLRGVTGVGRNITERKQRQRRFEAVFDNTYQFTGLMSPDGTILEVNQAAVDFAGQTRSDLVGQKLWDAPWFQTGSETRQVAETAVETAGEGEFFREQITVQGTDREAVIDFSVRPVTDADGGVELLIPEGRDITRLSEREQQLRVTNRFLRHNIRNKLTTVQGYADLIADVDDSRLRSFGEAIARAASELSATAETARDIHALIDRSPTPEPVDLAAHLDRAVDAVRRNHPGVTVTLDRPESLAATSIPSLSSALAELLGVVVDNAPDDRPRISVTAHSDDGAVVAVSSEDTLLRSAEREVLTGEIDIDQIRHAQGLAVWYVYWHVWYSGGAITATGDGIQVRLPGAAA